MSAAPLRVLRLGPLSLLWRPRAVLVGLALCGAVLVLALLLLGTGTLKLSPPEVIAALTGHSEDATARRMVQRIRLPRLLTGALVGMALGMAGAVFQSISRNPLGSPDLIGFTTGAATGAIVQIILFNAGPFETALAAALSGIVVAALVLALSRRGRGRGRGGGRGDSGGSYLLVLVGIGIGAILSGVNSVLLVMGDLDQAAVAQQWLSGSLNTRSWAHVWPLALGLGLIAPVVIWHARRLSALEMGDDMARQLGIPAERLRMTMVLAAVGLTSLATAAAGPIAFIALAAPQLARRLTRAPEVPVILAALMGAALLMAADLLSQRLPLRLNLPIGLMTGFLGGLYLIFTLMRGRSR
ncbi:FecCD family ABC transporter permease [Paracoccus aminophilus]|uniref:Ferric enterobactin transport system permease protein FepG n=1 Tax=Paracoccus aminophilus JCM 7686 TaxID=1367847 RepID=S5YYU4_PARAH|nr:iron chelate uptake ABC transporter family permease subunit [Paracoccus aminophilus]AGT10391.1 ferric enterobactin transport system permease protein FepG [Paracoccus aminophilus JCM 7686]